MESLVPLLVFWLAYRRSRVTACFLAQQDADSADVLLRLLRLLFTQLARHRRARGRHPLISNSRVVTPLPERLLLPPLPTDPKPVALSPSAPCTSVILFAAPVPVPPVALC
ncbi:hypothetical protein EVAR_95409_1 [Eumeta japonica]|uniref:Secreted protein n=1 Tax=Eumeta variegata TaxID=151549 RepID=A0A4C1VHB8_EUMVA|nr:hypothetical protein EVAR_95409_1 [Eumeta japonica]